MTIKTFRDLQEALSKLNDDQLNCDLILYGTLEDEWFPFKAELKIADEEEIDVVDDQHPYLVLDFGGNNEEN
jgi:hypothetical protein